MHLLDKFIQGEVVQSALSKLIWDQLVSLSSVSMCLWVWVSCHHVVTHIQHTAQTQATLSWRISSYFCCWMEIFYLPHCDVTYNTITTAVRTVVLKTLRNLYVVLNSLRYLLFWYREQSNWEFTIKWNTSICCSSFHPWTPELLLSGSYRITTLFNVVLLGCTMQMLLSSVV